MMSFHPSSNPAEAFKNPLKLMTILVVSPTHLKNMLVTNGSSPQIGMFPKIVGFPPKSSISNWVFHYKPSILGCFPIFGNTQISGWKFQKHRKNHHLDLDELMEPRYGALGSSWSWSSSNSAEWSDLRVFRRGFAGGGRNHTEALGGHTFCNKFVELQRGNWVQLGHFGHTKNLNPWFSQFFFCLERIFLPGGTLYIVYVDSPRFCWGDQLFFEQYSTNVSLLSTLCEYIMLRDVFKVCVSQVNDWFGKALVDLHWRVVTWPHFHPWVASHIFSKYLTAR